MYKKIKHKLTTVLILAILAYLIGLALEKTPERTYQFKGFKVALDKLNE